ncbi:hypothetical protein [Paraclostridium sordellii]|uniref:hypothetical protein n=1 Tax=Paraclostridium sordellii TaxID=1505 RepID=UPI0012D76BA8|nr:hypothetical protein [Paeniclostridium sordellii]
MFLGIPYFLLSLLRVNIYKAKINEKHELAMVMGSDLKNIIKLNKIDKILTVKSKETIDFVYCLKSINFLSGLFL